MRIRPRRLRENPILRRMVRETRLSVDQLIYPVFVVEGEGIREEIFSMPGQFRYSQDTLIEELGQCEHCWIQLEEGHNCDAGCVVLR